jgi:hypothetical protein
MTEATRVLWAECLRCGGRFQPSKHGHTFCSSECRHRGPRRPHEGEPPDRGQVARLFDAARDPGAWVRADDWRPSFAAAFVELDAHDTLGDRRRWYTELLELGRL